MRTLHDHQGEVYELSGQGMDRYGDENDRTAALHGLVLVRGEKEHWYAVWSMWSD